MAHPVPWEALAAGTGLRLGSQNGTASVTAGLAVGQSQIYSLWILRLLLLHVSVSSAQCCQQRGSGALEELFLFSVGTGG